MKKFINKLLLFTFLLAITTSGIGQTGKIRPGAASDFESIFLIKQNKIVKPSSYLKNAAFLSSMQAGADRLVALQNNDGGWDWPLDDGDPTSTSPLNTLGPIAMGLAQAYLYTNDAAHLAALSNAGALLLTKTNNFSPGDGYLAKILDQVFGVTTYSTHVNTNFYGPLAAGTYDRNGAGTLYSTADYVNLIRTSRASQGIPNLAAWDVGLGLIGAASCSAGTADWVAGVKGEIDELDGTLDYDVIGLAGAVYGLAFIGEDYTPTAGEHLGAADIYALADILISYQINLGGFTWNSAYVIPNDDNETVQETAYAMLALMTVDNAGYRSEILGAFDYLESVQLSTGGWKNWTGTGENNEVTAEALWAVAMVMQTGPVITIETPTAASCGVYEFDITVADFNLIGSISMTLDYDPAVLQFSGVTLNPAIAGSGYNDFTGTFILGGFYTPAFTLPDDAVLFTLTFNLLDWGATTTLSWPDTPPEANEIAGPNGDPVYIDSFFDITYTFPDVLGLSETHTDADCPCNATGSIDLTVTGGVTPYTYSWTGPDGFTSISEDLTGLFTGTYDVLVTDANGCTETLSVFIDFVPDNTNPSITCPPQIDVVCPQNVSWVTEVADITEIHCTAAILFNGGPEYWVDNGDWVYQSFHANSTGLLKSVSFGLMDIPTPRPFDITVSLYPGQPDCSANNRYPGGCPLWTGTMTFAAGGPNPDGIYTIEIPETARPYMIAGSQWYTLTFEGIGLQDDTWTHGWWVSYPDCNNVPGNYNDPMPGGGFYGWDLSTPYGGTCSHDSHTKAHVAFNTVMATIPGLSVSDNCTVKTVGTDIPSGSFFNYGITDVTFTVTDLAGNPNTCIMPVVVLDNVLPTIQCATPAASYNADPGVCDYTVAGPPPAFNTPKIDYFWISMGVPGSIGPGSGGTADDPGEDGVWYEYLDPNTSLEWWNIWFYNEPYNPDRMKIIRMGFWIQPNSPASGFINYVVNWSTDGWTGPGFPMPPDEIFIQRSPLNSMAVTGYEWVEIYFEIPDYNPEWVSVDIWGENFSIEPIPMAPPTTSPLFPLWTGESGGIIVHECLPKPGTFLDPIFDDNCEVDYVVNDYNGTNTLNGATFPVGTTTVVWTVYDKIGNSASCNYDVVVVDNEAPVITGCPANITVNTGPGRLTCDQVATWTEPLASDNCGILSFTSDWASGATFPVGITTVTYTATDIATPANVSTCSFTVTVVDNTVPTITCVVPANPYYVNTGCTYVVPGTALDPTGMGDNCGVWTVTNDFNGSATLQGAVFPVTSTTVVWTITDGATPPNTATCNYNVVVNHIALSGNLTYHNGGQTLSGVIITLDDGVTPITATTDGVGVYGYSNLCAGTYTLSANFGSKPVGGINSTDAAQVNYWGVLTQTTPWQIEKVRFYAGDAVLTNYLDANDASRILSYFVTAGSTPMVPTWKFWVAGETISANPGSPPSGLQNPTITIGGGDATIGLLGQVTGDFNMSYSLATKGASESLLLKEGKNIFAEVGSELELPIVAGMDMDVGAVSLILNFPSDKIEISDVFLTSDPSSPVMYNITGDELRIGWNSLIPAYLNIGESLITLKLKVIDDSGTEGISLSLEADPLNELADGNFIVINDAVLIADVIHTSALGITSNVADRLALANHPNPFKGTTNFVYSLPIDGKVILEIYDLVGNKVMTVVDEAQTAGEYTIKLDANRLQPGVYTANLRLSNEDSKLVRTIKILSR